MNLVITGSSTGIGKFLADSLTAQGHAVCRVARSAQEGFALRRDVSNWSDMKSAASQVAQKWKSVDGLICCAGIQQPIGPTMEIDPAAWRSTMAVNLDGTFFTIRAFYSLLKKASQRAKIICFSGGGSTSPRPNFAAYGVSKTGVVRLVETLATEWKDERMDINAVAPGAIFTKMTEQVLASGPQAAGSKEFEQASKLARDNAASLAKVLGLVEFLLSAKSDGITGRLLSAPWDPWLTLDQRREELAASDIYTLRRIVPEDRGKNWSTK